LRPGLQKHVVYLGFRKDMEQVYAQADAIVLPSRIEPFGMAPIQGMLHGLVPIVSSVSGVAELLKDGENALILNNHLDAHELAALMAKLMNERALTSSMQEKAKTTAAALTWDKAVEANIRAYYHVLTAKKRT
ncbi:MAG TPA: glycosyltransferase family 4 protein, partial [Candidatus Obscuribacterales bacterium]